jgi:hypothetical protein
MQGVRRCGKRLFRRVRSVPCRGACAGTDPAGGRKVQIAPRIPAGRFKLRTRLASPWLVALLALVVVLGGLFYWLSLESTLRSAAAWVTQHTEGRVAFEDPHGSLLSRATASRIVWRREGGTVTSEDVSLRWSPLWLLAGVITVDNVTAQRMTVETRPSSAPSTRPSSLKPALRVRIARAHVGELDLVRGGSPTTFRNVGFSAGAGWHDWYFKLEPATTPWGLLTADARVGETPPFDVHANLAFKRDTPSPAELTMKAEGPLERMNLTASLSAKGSSLDATAIATPYADMPVDAIDVTLRAFDPRNFAPAAPQALFTGGLSAKRDGDVARGKVEIANSMAGSLDTGRVPLASVTAAIDGRPDALTLQDLLIDLGAAGRLAGIAKLVGEEVSVDLASEKVNLHAVHASLQPTDLKGRVGVTGDLASQSVRLDLAQRDYTLALAGQVTGDAIVVRDARASIAGGSIRASGSVGLDPSHPYTFKATLAHFDPSRVGVSRSASLNGSVSAEGSVSPQLRVRADVNLAPSTLFGLPAQGSLRWRSVGIAQSRISIAGRATIGATRLAVDGHVVDPQNLKSLDARLDLTGADMHELYTIFHVPLPPTADYHVDGRLRHQDDVWSFDNFHGRVGRSDLAGSYVVDNRNPRMFVKANLTSTRLDITDLSGFIGAGPHEPKVPGKVLPQNQFRLDKLRDADADVTFTGERFINPTLPLNRMHTHLVLRNGLLTLNPFEFGAAGGRLFGMVAVDARKPTISADADLRASDINLARLAPTVQALADSTGKLDARMHLTGQGNSLAAMLGSANGNVASVMEGGAVSDLVLRLMNLDIANSLVALAKGNQKIPIRCVVADFQARDGVLTPDPLVLDTEHTLVTGEGRIMLKDEQLDLRLVAEPKDGSVLALRGPINVQGTMAKPTVTPELGQAIARTAAAVGLGIVAGPAAIIPLIQIGKPENVDCATYVQKATSFISQQ